MAIALLWLIKPDHDPDVHTELRQRLLEAELGSAVNFHFATPPQAPDLARTSLSDLLGQLRSANPVQRWQAADRLADAGDSRAVDALIQAMRDPDGTVRVCVMAEALGRLKDPRAVGALTEAAFDQTNRDLRFCAIQSLGMIGDRRAVPKLIEALEARNNPVEAANSLARLADARAVEPMIRAAKDPALRFWMITALGELGNPKALPFLAAQGNDPQPVIRETAAEAAWKISIVSARDPVAALTQILTQESSSPRRMWAAFRLGERGDARAAPALIQALADPDRDVRGRAAAALVRLGASALPAVRQAAEKHSEPTQGYAMAVLGYLDTETDIPVLRQIANHAPTPLAKTADRSVQLIQQFTAYRTQHPKPVVVALPE
jgi:HEAT repeat protein